MRTKRRFDSQVHILRLWTGANVTHTRTKKTFPLLYDVCVSISTEAKWVFYSIIVFTKKKKNLNSLIVYEEPIVSQLVKKYAFRYGTYILLPRPQESATEVLYNSCRVRKVKERHLFIIVN